ncbi:MAG TPA: nuclear transport factor 2 family protein [Pyrinomonadaceae bacterium]|nr:nuclear transport factor 2 family protein [Pyrinomonadaceae bacterium]
MIKRLLFAATLAAALAPAAVAQNTNTNASAGRMGTTGRRANTRATPSATPKPTQPAQETTGAQTEGTTTGAGTRRAASTRTTPAATESAAVREAFDSLVDGIRRADANAVMSLYWNSPQLSVFNNNGTVTKSWEQARSNRESLYAKISDVKLDVRDVRVKTLGPTAALVTCLWEQSQTADGQPEHATGRLTIVYQKIGTAWKIVHTHTSPDKPNPANILPSERTPAGDTTQPAKPPARP